MKLKYLTLVLENCDSIEIEGKYVGDFLVDDLKTSIKRIACNSIDKIEVANTIAIEIHKDANKERYQFAQTQNEDCKQMTFERLDKCADITSIYFVLEKDYVEPGQVPCEECYNYYVDWTGESEYVNEAQKTYISKGGHLYIVIADGKKIEDFFDLQEIEDEEHMDFHFDMCDVGDEYSNPDRYENEENNNSLFLRK